MARVDKVEMAFGADFATAEGTRTWTDVTGYVVGEIGIGYGRADEQGQPSPNTASVTLENIDGRFTPGNTGGAYYPNIKKGVPLRVSVTYTDLASGNYLTANNASFETSVSGWGSSDPSTTIAQSSVRAQDGTKSALVTWPTVASTTYVGTSCRDLIPGWTYIASAYVYVATGAPNPRVQITDATGAVIATGSRTSTKNAWTRISVSFTATGSYHAVGVEVASATSGQQMWVDAVQVDDGSSLTAFTTSPGRSSVRFTGYVGEWPVQWPTGGDTYSTVTVTAASRRARLGQTAPLPSAIRAANLRYYPAAYYPMDETDIVADVVWNRDVFFDIAGPTLYGTGGRPDWNRMPLGLYTPGVEDASYVVLGDGTPGPTDETSMVQFSARNSTTLDRYAGGASRIRVNTDPVGAGHQFTFAVAARVNPGAPSTSRPVDVNLAQIYSQDMYNSVWFFLYHDGLQGYVGVDAQMYDSNNILIDSPAWYYATGLTDGDMEQIYARATDGEIHHYLVTADGSGYMYLFFDGEWIAWVSLDTHSFQKPFVNVGLGTRTKNATAWIGHFLADDYYFDATMAANVANGSTTSLENIYARAYRLTSYLAVPAAEVDVDYTIAVDLGSQAEKDRSASEVLDEIAQSTGGVMHDRRTGELKMRSRNARYDATSSFTLSTSGDEIEADLTAVLDDRYLVNRAEITRVGSVSPPAVYTDTASVATYGVYVQQVQMVSTSDDEAEALGNDIVYRYKDPKPRVSQVTVDVGDLSPTQRALVLSADIGTRFTTAGLPAQAPSSSLDHFLEGYTESISVTGGHRMTINTTPAGDYPSLQVVGTATVGSSTLVVY